MRWQREVTTKFQRSTHIGGGKKRLAQYKELIGKVRYSLPYSLGLMLIFRKTKHSLPHDHKSLVTDTRNQLCKGLWRLLYLTSSFSAHLGLLSIVLF